MRILMVCLGNICRSPLAEGIMRAKIGEHSLAWRVASAGTGANYHLGSKPDPNSIQVAQQHGIDISQQRARQFLATDMVDFDHIYVMDKENYHAVQAISGHLFLPNKVSLLLHELSEAGTEEVDDPYQKGIGAFQSVYTLIERACEAIVQKYANGTSA